MIHLIRKIERIDRDIEEIQNLLSNLQMDREYSQRLKDSLIEEYHRFKDLKKEILKQVILIPPQFKEYLISLFPELNEEPIIETEISITKTSSPSLESIKQKEISHLEEQEIPEEKNSGKEVQQKKDSIKKVHEKPKHSPFLFRFQ